jgi:hypothetical protein
MQLAGTMVIVHYAKSVYLNKLRKLCIGIVESN